MMNAPKFVLETKGSIEIEAPAKTDFFIDMLSMKVREDAPFYFEKWKGDFVMRAKVRPEFKATYDAGGLFIYDSGKKWIKYEFEMTDLGYPCVVYGTNGRGSRSCEKVSNRLWLWSEF